MLSFEEITEVIQAAVELGITRVRVTGGEPLVRMLAAIPKLRDLALTTNGVLLARNASALAEAGLKRINISLDTLRRIAPSASPASVRLRTCWRASVVEG